MCAQGEREERAAAEGGWGQPHQEDEGDQRGCEGLSADRSTGDRMLGSNGLNQNVPQDHGGEGD